jgi:hypothetical protein
MQGVEVAGVRFQQCVGTVPKEFLAASAAPFGVDVPPVVPGNLAGRYRDGRCA